MNCVSLNIRGVGGVSKVRQLRDLIRVHSVEFVALQETLISGDAYTFVRTLWGQGDFGFCQITAEGRSGGILSIWKKDSFQAINAFAGRGFLCVEGRWNGISELISIINVYAPQDDGQKRTLWLDICSYLATSSNLFCLMGDFNTVRNQDERFGCSFHKRRADDFNAFIMAAQLQELQMGGRRFTWVGQGGLKLSKLDRFLLSSELLGIWPQVRVLALDRCFSDHCPILLKSNKADYGPVPFRFFNQWIHKEGF